jgi:hypothetical protein
LILSHRFASCASMTVVKPVEIRVDSDGGFIDFNLTMVSFHRTADGVCHVTAQGFHQGRIVGFRVDMGSAWERQDLENSRISLYWGEATLISIGEESDAFLQVVDEAWQTNLGRQKMRDRIPFIAVGLDSDPRSMEDLPISMKLFSQTDSEEDDAEFFLNVDARNLSVQFREKDPEYRRGVVVALSAMAS